ncbi:TMEM43 family protein [Aureimonas glaciei]|uniref:Transmembrane protein n=1 Tax=Aureimonas glaciei TaxID=1776957 RepID=A0A916XWR0_9HYPH|nr:TMEM43 family protein [Aureimonas glaciei]GGD18217.1 hypothetical protein GCM10011335_21380 [Aureimonas glaciei]
MSNSTDSVTEVTSVSWFRRIFQSVAGVLVGIVLVLIVIGVLFWNEGRAVVTAQSLSEGQSTVVSIDPATVQAANEGKLVYAQGDAVVADPLVDPLLGVEAAGIRLQRQVEMFQWKESSKSETRTKLGGGEETVTTYTYARDWAEGPIDSSEFHAPAGHENPEMPLGSDSIQAPAAAFGGFTLGDEVLSQVSGDEPVALSADAGEQIEAALAETGRPVTVALGRIFVGENANAPALGDLRISYTKVPAGPLSLIAQQSGDSFTAYQTQAGDRLLLVDSGAVSLDKMFADAQSANVVITWIVRLVGLVLLFIGFALVTKPISVVASVVPLLGDLVGLGTGLIAFVAATVTGGVTIAIAWFFYRPLLALLILAVTAAIVFGIVALRRRRLAAGALPSGARPA